MTRVMAFVFIYYISVSSSCICEFLKSLRYISLSLIDNKNLLNCQTMPWLFLILSFQLFNLFTAQYLVFSLFEIQKTPPACRRQQPPVCRIFEASELVNRVVYLCNRQQGGKKQEWEASLHCTALYTGIYCSQATSVHQK